MTMNLEISISSESPDPQIIDDVLYILYILLNRLYSNIVLQQLTSE